MRCWCARVRCCEVAGVTRSPASTATCQGSRGCRSTPWRIGSNLADQFEAEGLTGHPRLWQRERMRILGDLMVLLNDDDRWRAERDASVVASELRFGFDGEPPVEIPVPSGRVLLRGSADKIDLGQNGTIYVTD